jgi:hypothetical protein
VPVLGSYAGDMLILGVFLSVFLVTAALALRRQDRSG